MNTIILFPDTNLFLQCRPLEDLPWHDSFTADRIRLLVAAAVQDEIDHLKNEGELRRGRRARNTTTLFRRALAQLPAALVIRERAPEVVLEFAPALPSDRVTAASLDRLHPDDALIDEVMHFVAAPGESVQIATLDVGMMLRARRHQVATFDIPDAWKLPPELDERDKRVQTLERQIAELRRAEPQLTLEASDERGRALTKLTAQIDTFATLTNEELDRFQQSVQRKYPRATWQARGAAQAPQPPSADPIAQLNAALLKGFEIFQTVSDEQRTRYQTAYQEWLARARERFESLSRCRNARARLVPFRLRLQNIGTVPADELLVEILVRGGLRMCIAEDNALPPPVELAHRVPSEVTLQAPPRAPQNSLDLMSSQLALSSPHGFGLPHLHTPFEDMARHIRPVHRDRHSFYGREDDSEAVTKYSLECAEFRHGIGPRELKAWIIIQPERDVAHGHLFCRVSARNLAKPIRLRVPIELSYIARSTNEIAERWTCRGQNSGAPDP